jgi:hypothetical protein
LVLFDGVGAGGRNPVGPGLHEVVDVRRTGQPGHLDGGRHRLEQGLGVGP